MLPQAGVTQGKSPRWVVKHSNLLVLLDRISWFARVLVAGAESTAFRKGAG